MLTQTYLFKPHFIGKKLVEDFGRVRVGGAPPPLLHHLRRHLKHLVLMMLQFVIELTQSAALGAHREVLQERDFQMTHGNISLSCFIHTLFITASSLGGTVLSVVGS